MSLDRHINLGWRHFLCRELGEFIDVVPPQQRIDEHWYQGTADAVYQNIYTIEKERPEYVVILAGDHIYKMDYSKLVDHHQRAAGRSDRSRALRVTANEARQFGVMEVDDDDRIIGFEEKPAEPKTIPGDPSTAWRRWASTFSRPGFSSSSFASTPPSRDSVARFRPEHHPVDHRFAPRLRLSVPGRKPQRATPTGAMSARWTPTTKPIWT